MISGKQVYIFYIANYFPIYFKTILTTRQVPAVITYPCIKCLFTAAEQYLDNAVWAKSDGIDEMGAPNWWLVLCLLAAWIVIFGCLIKGIKSSGRVVYFTATFPYLILVILLIRAVTLDGAYDGIQFYMVPDWSRLSDIKVWEAAAVQIFFSLSVAGGGLITLASYNKFHNNVLR